jgi:hypothetical protein
VIPDSSERLYIDQSLSLQSLTIFLLMSIFNSLQNIIFSIIIRNSEYYKTQTSWQSNAYAL